MSNRLPPDFFSRVHMSDNKKTWVRPVRSTRPTEVRPEFTRPAMTTETIAPDAASLTDSVASPAIGPAPIATAALIAEPAESLRQEASPHSHTHHHADGTGCCLTTPASDGLAAASETAASTMGALPLAPSTEGVCCETTSSASCSSDAASAEAGTESEDSGIDDGALIDALREVIDPELMINIVDLGLVYSINHTDRKVAVDMTLTSPACPAGPQIIMQSKMALEKVAGVDVAEIKLVMSPPWTPARMTDEARDQLGIF